MFSVILSKVSPMIAMSMFNMVNWEKKVAIMKNAKQRPVYEPNSKLSELN